MGRVPDRRSLCESGRNFLSSIKKTLQKHVPPHAQGPLISNTLNTAFQFQMSVWRMIGEECIRPVRRSTLTGVAWPALSRRLSRPFPRTVLSCFLCHCPRPRWLRSPVPSGHSHLTMMMTMMTVIMMPAPASAGLILPCRCPHTGTLAELAKQVALTCPHPYLTGMPSVYQPTPRSHPVALLARLQMRTRNVAHC